MEILLAIVNNQNIRLIFLHDETCHEICRKNKFVVWKKLEKT